MQYSSFGQIAKSTTRIWCFGGHAHTPRTRFLYSVAKQQKGTPSWLSLGMYQWSLPELFCGRYWMFYDLEKVIQHPLLGDQNRIGCLSWRVEGRPAKQSPPWPHTLEEKSLRKMLLWAELMESVVNHQNRLWSIITAECGLYILVSFCQLRFHLTGPFFFVFVCYESGVEPLRRRVFVCLWLKPGGWDPCHYFLLVSLSAKKLLLSLIFLDLWWTRTTSELMGSRQVSKVQS